MTEQQSRSLASARQLLAAGKAREAAEHLAPLIAGGWRAVDPLLTYSEACEQLGLTQDALGACQAAIQTNPDRADVWARFGRMLLDSGRAGEALQCLERSVAIDDSSSEAWYNLGLAALRSGDTVRAREALEQSVALSPKWAMAWAALGLVQQQSDTPEAAEESLRTALSLDPTLVSARHNLAVSLRRLDRPEEALAELDRLAATGPVAVETETLRTHLLGDLGRLEEAADRYVRILETAPNAIDAHETLARLLPQIGRGAEALDAYERALSRSPTPELFGSALNSAWDVKDGSRLTRWADDAMERLGDRVEFRLMKGLGLGLTDGPKAALAILEPLAASGSDWIRSQCAYFSLQAGDLDAAEEHALAGTRSRPLDQAGWAYLTVIWRLKGDSREQWLADYDRFVMPIDLEPPAGFGTQEEFLAALASELHGLHTTSDHPAEQSVRGGTQTRGNLFNKRSPIIVALSEQIEQAIAGAIARLPADPEHPFLSRNTGRTKFAGSWSIRIRSGGFHASHIHQQGWLSSALYVSVPPEVTEGGYGGEAPGALAFGIPDPALKLDLAPRRIETPVPGRLVLFPSYFWHGTLPFESSEPRLTVAFDAVPAAIESGSGQV